MEHSADARYSDDPSGEERYRVLADLTSDGVVLADRAGRFVEINPTLCAMLGYSRTELLQLGWSEIIVGAALASEQVDLDDLCLGERGARCLRARGGHELSVEMQTRRLSDGNLLSVVCDTDVQRLLRAESALRTSEERYRLLAENISDVIWVLDVTTGRFRYISPSIERARGYTVEEALAERMDQALTPESMAYIAQYLPSRIAAFYAGNEQPYTDELAQPCKDGSRRWFEVISRFVINQTNGHLEVYGTSRDNSLRRQAEAALHAERAQLAEQVAAQTADLRIANAELARAARLKDEFLASMSHELRTPLNAILGRCELLQEQIYGPLAPRQVDALRSIDASGHHLLELINDILDLSKIESGKLDLQLGPVHIYALCQASLQLVAQVAVFKQIALTMSIDTQASVIYADERRLKQVLVNLLSNAIKFTPTGGSVGLEVKADQAPQTLSLSVWDTGIGISATDLPLLFQPFVQIDSGLNRQYAGTGLGLVLVRRLTIAHGGDVTVDSAPGKGSRFTVTLPWQVAPAVVTLAPVPQAIPQTSLARALLIEDSHIAVEQISRYLNELGVHVEVHMQADGALERALAIRPDVIVLDILLPDEPGWGVLRKLKADERTNGIPVIVVSVVDQPAYSRQLGAVAHLAKPVNRAALADALRRAAMPQSDTSIQAALLIIPQEPIGTPRLHILLAEDNEEQSQIVSEYLRMQGYEVAVARNGSEALTLLTQILPQVVVMDIQMPGMDGLEAIRRIRSDARTCEVAIIALTALAMSGDRERCLQAGADVYLSKPVSLRQLAQEIQSHVH